MFVYMCRSVCTPALKATSTTTPTALNFSLSPLPHEHHLPPLHCRRRPRPRCETVFSQKRQRALMGSGLLRRKVWKVKQPRP